MRVVNIFDITSGITLILLVLSVLSCILLIISCDFERCEDQHVCFIVLFGTLSIVCALAIVANTLFSFISIVKIVYLEYTAYTADCSSPAFYSAFIYVTIEFITLAAIIFIIIGVIIYWCSKSR